MIRKFMRDEGSFDAVEQWSPVARAVYQGAVAIGRAGNYVEQRAPKWANAARYAAREGASACIQGGMENVRYQYCTKEGLVQGARKAGEVIFFAGMVSGALM